MEKKWITIIVVVIIMFLSVLNIPTSVLAIEEELDNTNTTNTIVEKKSSIAQTKAEAGAPSSGTTSSIPTPEKTNSSSEAGLSDQSTADASSGTKANDLDATTGTSIESEHVPVIDATTLEGIDLVEDALLGAEAEAYSGTTLFRGNSNHVAKVEEKTFATLQEAIDSIDSSGVIVIIENIDVNADETIRIPTGKNISITDDGNKRTVTKRIDVTNNNKEPEPLDEPLFIIEKGATLTVKASSNKNLIFLQDQWVGFMKEFKNKGSLFHVLGKLNLASATIHLRGFESKASFSGGIYVSEDAVFNMSGGIITGMGVFGAEYTSAVFVSSGGTFNLSGGHISENTMKQPPSEGTLSSGGGVLLFVWNRNQKPAIMNMTGGSISKNSALNGGGVYMTGQTIFNFSGGKISENKALNGNGGGVCVAAKSSEDLPDTTIFNMTGGEICDNEAKNGGGIYVNSDKVYLQAGEIKGNKAIPNSTKSIDSTKAIDLIESKGGHGGGVYVSIFPRVLHISNAIITENTAFASNGTSGLGGGIWACPTGRTQFKVTNGVAVFDNSAENPNAAGDDIVQVYSEQFKENPDLGKMTLPNRMLGGGKVKWYSDGEVSDGAVGSAKSEAEAARYSESNPGEPFKIKDKKGTFAAKAVTSQAAKVRASEEAKLVITKNEAAHGGGLGTNGAVITPNYDETFDWKLKVNKVWDENVADSAKEEVEIYLKINETILDSVLLNADNNWKAEFTELPSPNTLTGQSISVLEGERITHADGKVTIKETSKWDVSYENITSNEEYTLIINVTNKDLDKVDIPVQIVWDDANNQNGKRPENVTIKLLADGVYINKLLSLSEINNWAGISEQLDKYKDGKTIIYSIEVESLDNYISTITGNIEEGFVVTISYKPEPPVIPVPNESNQSDEINLPMGKVNIPVQIVWDDANNQNGKRPENVTIKLLADGVYINKLLSLSEINNWAWIFEQLDKYKDGKTIIYSIEVESLDNYISTITGNIEEGFVVTISYKSDTLVMPSSNELNQSGEIDSTTDSELVSRIPRTGDDRRAPLFIALGLLFSSLILLNIRRILKS